MKHVRLFQPSFASLVESGMKLQTIRKTPVRMPKPGDSISLRTWTGAPYRSKQRILREAKITLVENITITIDQITCNGWNLCKESEDDLAKADGFQTAMCMRNWFILNHGLPFTGIVIHWT